jgi:hypothetical protein
MNVRDKAPAPHVVPLLEAERDYYLPATGSYCLFNDSLGPVP